MTKHTTSSVREWRNCRRSYKHKYVDLVRIAKKSRALNMGTAFHDGDEQFHLGKGLSDILLAAAKHQEDLDPIDYRKVRAMLRVYYARWKDDRQDWEVIETEGEFEADIHGHRFGGKRDGVLRYKPTGRVYVWETKTCTEDVSKADADYWQRLDMDLQTSAYVHTLPDQDVGIIYNVARKPTSKPKMKTAVRKRKSETQEEYEARKEAEMETLDEYEERLVEEMTEKADEYFVRRQVFRQQAEQDRVIAELHETLSEMGSYSGIYPRNESACKTKFGTCPYLGVCAGIETLNDSKFKKIESEHPELSGQTQTTEVNNDHAATCPI